MGVVTFRLERPSERPAALVVEVPHAGIDLPADVAPQLCVDADAVARDADRYVDDRIGEFTANLVAPQGQRLRRGVSWATIAVIGVFLFFWLGGIVLSSFG